MVNEDTGAHKQVLVIDDHNNDLTLIYEHLREHYSVTTVNNVNAALTIMDSGFPFYFVLTDLVLPPDHTRNGIDFIRIMKTKEAPVPIIAMSGEATPEVAARAIREGAIDFFDKAKLKAPGGNIEDTLGMIEQRVGEFHEHHRNQRELLERATIDEKTGLYNCAQFKREWREEVSRHNRIIHSRKENDLSMLFMDINHMKPANDELGHSYVDKFVLALLGKALNQSFQRKSLDKAYRFGGDEITVILKETDANGAAIVAQRIIEKYDELRTEIKYNDYVAIGGTIPEAKFAIASREYATLSIGIVQVPQKIGEGEKYFSPEILVGWADKAMYHAKALAKSTSPPRSQWVIYIPGMEYPDKAIK